MSEHKPPTGWDSEARWLREHPSDAPVEEPILYDRLEGCTCTTIAEAHGHGMHAARAEAAHPATDCQHGEGCICVDPAHAECCGQLRESVLAHPATEGLPTDALRAALESIAASPDGDPAINAEVARAALAATPSSEPGEYEITDADGKTWKFDGRTPPSAHPATEGLPGKHYHDEDGVAVACYGVHPATEGLDVERHCPRCRRLMARLSSPEGQKKAEE